MNANLELSSKNTIKTSKPYTIILSASEKPLLHPSSPIHPQVSLLSPPWPPLPVESRPRKEERGDGDGHRHAIAGATHAADASGGGGSADTRGGVGAAGAPAGARAPGGPPVHRPVQPPPRREGDRRRPLLRLRRPRREQRRRCRPPHLPRLPPPRPQAQGTAPQSHPSTPPCISPNRIVRGLDKILWF